MGQQHHEMHATSALVEPPDQVRVWPNRSLNKRSHAILIGSVAFIFATLAVWAFKSGTWPVLIYQVLALGGFAYALCCNNRSGRVAETIEFGPQAIRVTRGGPAARKAGSAEFNPYWVRVVEVPGRWGEKRLAFRESGRSFFIGDFLSEDERLELGRELRSKIKHRYYGGS
jgi:uncharacterized membrane protein